MAFRMNSKQLLKAAAFSLLASPAAAFWRMECRGETGLARLDPIVNPGVVGDHLHTIFGSSGMHSPH